MNALSHTALVLCLSLVPACGDDDAGATAPGPSARSDRPALEVVNERMQAYNLHDLEAFMSTYADDVEVFTYPDRSLGKGKAHMRGIFAPMFERGQVQVTLHHQIAKDGYVVNHESVVDGDETTEYVSIYEVRGGLIQSVRFVRD